MDKEGGDSSKTHDAAPSKSAAAPAHGAGDRKAAAPLDCRCATIQSLAYTLEAVPNAGGGHCGFAYFGPMRLGDEITLEYGKTSPYTCVELSFSDDLAAPEMLAMPVVAPLCAAGTFGAPVSRVWGRFAIPASGKQHRYDWEAYPNAALPPCPITIVIKRQ